MKDRREMHDVLRAQLATLRDQMRTDPSPTPALPQEKDQDDAAP